MAIVHRATLTPGKEELIARWLDRQPWAGTGVTTKVINYRFDDPAGEVGVEAMVFRRGERLLHVPVSYRGAPIDGADDALIGTSEHSVLGMRWFYDAIADPVAVACFAAAALGKQEPAVVEVHDGGDLVETWPSPVALRVEDGETAAGDGSAAVADVDGQRLAVVRVIGDAIDGRRRLIATWSDGEATVAALT